jgi:hypothetical protein
LHSSSLPSQRPSSDRWEAAAKRLSTRWPLGYAHNHAGDAPGQASVGTDSGHSRTDANKPRNSRNRCGALLVSAPERIRTSGLCLRRAALYPTELRARMGARRFRGSASRAARLPCYLWYRVRFRNEAPARKRREPIRETSGTTTAPAARSRAPPRTCAVSRVLSRLAAVGHFSRIAVASDLQQPTRDWTERAAPRPLFGLAPGGVCLATPVTGGPVRSYRTVSPLPEPR